MESGGLLVITDDSVSNIYTLLDIMSKIEWLKETQQFCYCQQIPWKDQNQKNNNVLSLLKKESLNTFLKQ